MVHGISHGACDVLSGVWHLAWHVACGNSCGMWEVTWHGVCGKCLLVHGKWRGMRCMAFSVARCLC